jgi:N4-bis(aminopropyl)spermidine synthase
MSIKRAGEFAVETQIIEIIENSRPLSIRKYDQIPMIGNSLISQTREMLTHFSEKSIVFVGDHDCTSLAVGLLNYFEGTPLPKKMLLLDFDERLLLIAKKVAREYGFEKIFETRLYNVFDPIPKDLIGKFDLFYTNPPYGAKNEGRSIHLFATRGCETIRCGGCGFIIAPNDDYTDWAKDVYTQLKNFFNTYNWNTTKISTSKQNYYLDDEPDLTSMCLKVTRNSLQNEYDLPWMNQKVSQLEIPNFYGYSVIPPYPHYIGIDGSEIFESMPFLKGKLNNDSTSTRYMDFPSKSQQIPYPRNTSQRIPRIVELQSAFKKN